MNNKLISQQK